MSPPLALITEPIDDACLRWLAQRCRTRCLDVADPAFEHSLKEAAALVVRTYTRVDEALLRRAPNLRVVGRAGVGLDNVDLHACRLRDVVVVHTPEANTDAVVEFTIARVLDALRPRPAVDRALPPAKWKRLRDDLITPKQAAGAALGVLGFGRIGSRVARAAAALSMRVQFCDLLEFPQALTHGAVPVSFDALLRDSDALTIHVDARPENRNLIAEPELQRCKPDAAIINTARGFVIDPDHLAQWLRTHPSAGAWLDVHQPEPIPESHPLLNLPNAHLTPHIAAATRPAKAAMSRVVHDVWRVLEGEQPRFRAV